MAKTEWFRRTTWTAADEAEFRERLNRSRGSFHKAQYLRIQAGYLQEIGTEDMYRAALTLLDEVVRDYPERLQLSEAHRQRAECLAALGSHEDAIVAYRESFATQREFPQVRGLAYLGFAELILALGRRDLYPEALSMLDEFGCDELFPIHRYRSAATRAFIYDAMADRDQAALNARFALSAAAETESPFRYHRKLGLVDHPEAAVQARLWRLAGTGPGSAT